MTLQFFLGCDDFSLGTISIWGLVALIQFLCIPVAMLSHKFDLAFELSALSLRYFLKFNFLSKVVPNNFSYSLSLIFKIQNRTAVSMLLPYDTTK